MDHAPKACCGAVATVAALVLLLHLSPLAAAAQECPDNAVKVGENIVDGKRRIACKCVSGFAQLKGKRVRISFYPTLVTVKRGVLHKLGPSGFEPVAGGASVKEGDELLTGPDALVELELADGSLERLGPNTGMKVARLGGVRL